MPDPSPVRLNNKIEAHKVFGVPIEGPSLGEVLELIERRSLQRQSTWIVTANPEILLFAKDHPTYAETLKQADLRTVDGIGLWLALRLSGQSVARLTGVDLAEALIDFADQKKWRVGLIGGGNQVAEQSAEFWRKKYPELKIQVEQGGLVDDCGKGDAANEEARYRLTMFDPQVLLVAFGHPKQEQWIERYATDFASLRVVVGVGGTFDFWTGKARRSPLWMRKLGLEWLWRLIVEPRRWKRIWRAVVVFPWSYLFDVLAQKP